MPPDSQPIVTCVFGPRGSGKTTLTRQLIRERSSGPALFHDPFGEYDTIHVESVGLAAAYCDHARNLARVTVGVANFCVEDEAERLCALAWGIAQRTGSLLFIIEEADHVAPPFREPQWLRRVIAQGRHAGIELIAVSRRPAEVSRLLTSQAGRIISFRCHEPRDALYLRSTMGPLADRIPGLPDHEYVD